MLRKIINCLFFKEKWTLYYMSVEICPYFYDVTVIKYYKKKGKSKSVLKSYYNDQGRCIEKMGQLRGLQMEKQLINKKNDMFTDHSLPNFIYLN